MNGAKIAVAATLLAVTGCSGDDNSATKVQPRTAEAVLEAVQQDLEDRDVGRYSSRVLLEQYSYGSEKGHYVLSTDRFRVVRSVKAPEGSLTTDVRVIGDDLYMQMRDWPDPMSGCWLTFTRSELESMAGLVAADEPGPTPVAAVLAAEGAKFAPGHRDSLRVSVPAYLGLAVFQLSGRVLAELPDLTDERVPAVLKVDGERVTSLRLDGPAVAKSLDRAGLDLGPTAGRGLRFLHVDVSFGTAQSVRIAEPDEALVVEGDAGMDRGCR